MELRISEETSRRLGPGDLAPAVEVLDVHSRSIGLQDMWGDGPVLLTFLRHFG